MTSKDIVDIITLKLKSNKDKKLWSTEDLFDGIKLNRKKKMIRDIVELLKFYKVIEFDSSTMCWRNSYFEED